jgi:hypothetical protein
MQRTRPAPTASSHQRTACFIHQRPACLCFVHQRPACFVHPRPHLLARPSCHLTQALCASVHAAVTRTASWPTSTSRAQPPPSPSLRLYLRVLRRAIGRVRRARPARGRGRDPPPTAAAASPPAPTNPTARTARTARTAPRVMGRHATQRPQQRENPLCSHSLLPARSRCSARRRRGGLLRAEHGPPCQQHCEPCRPPDGFSDPSHQRRPNEQPERSSGGAPRRAADAEPAVAAAGAASAARIGFAGAAERPPHAARTTHHAAHSAQRERHGRRDAIARGCTAMTYGVPARSRSPSPSTLAPLCSTACASSQRCHHRQAHTPASLRHHLQAQHDNLRSSQHARKVGHHLQVHHLPPQQIRHLLPHPHPPAPSGTRTRRHTRAGRALQPAGAVRRTAKMAGRGRARGGRQPGRIPASRRVPALTSRAPAGLGHGGRRDTPRGT